MCGKYNDSDAKENVTILFSTYCRRIFKYFSSFIFLVALGFELRASCLQSWLYILLEPPDRFALDILEMGFFWGWS
jgi:hypothetical protein